MVDGIGINGKSDVTNQSLAKLINGEKIDKTGELMESLFNMKIPKGDDLDYGLPKFVPEDDADEGLSIHDLRKLLPLDLEANGVEFDHNPKDLVAKDSAIKKGRLVKNSPQVTQKQVDEFLKKINMMGYDIKAEEVMSSSGKLSPLFKVDDNGNISLINPQAFEIHRHNTFETISGDWAVGIDESRKKIFKGVI